ncbi:MAG TPA: CHAT domain-containing protein [Solirubrobacterales bacterium]|nr:CHAT domain-containing protein [Solirubrobacterales bacterium]
MRRIRSEQVTWYETDSFDSLAELLREIRPELKGAYVIEYTGAATSRHYVFSGSDFKRLHGRAAAEDFAAEHVRDLLLERSPALRTGANTHPLVPAFEPETGAVWVATGSRGGTRSSPVAAAAPSEEAGDSLRRTPHLDVSAEDGLVAGAKFRVEVFCDLDEARAGEQSEDINVLVPAGQEHVTLQAWLALSSHFEAVSAAGEITISRNKEESTRARFDLAVKGEPPPGPGWICAIFSYDGRACGQVTRTLAVGVSTAPEPAAEPEPLDAPTQRPPGIAARPGARPDLTIEIKATDRSEQNFDCRLITALLPGRLAPEPTKWELSSRAPKLVSSYMEGFTERKLSDSERISKLRGAGMDLWKAAPPELHEVFWELIEKGKPLESIFVVSDEWSFPWELVVPHRGRSDAAEQRQPLGIEFAVGRWVTDDMISPPQKVDLVDSYVFAPDYKDKKKLPKAAAEADYVCRNLNGEPITPGNFDPLEEKFAAGGVSLAHFVCHGGTSTERSQVLGLEDGGRLESHQIGAMDALKTALADKQPFVFLNACQVGSPQPALVGVGGFATAFIDAGATCVIAPLWSVGDTVAHDLATGLYDALRDDPKLTPAAALKELRVRAYAEGGSHSWAAYCFYGDPLTAVAMPKTNKRRGD